jgi:hypothetical protein
MEWKRGCVNSYREAPFWNLHKTVVPSGSGMMDAPMYNLPLFYPYFIQIGRQRALLNKN